MKRYDKLLWRIKMHDIDLHKEIESLNSKRKEILDTCKSDDEKTNATLALDIMILETIDRFIHEECLQEEIATAFELYSEISKNQLKIYLK
jgi:hypothetical protein